MQINFVRRIDDLGRIVIPKEIRSQLKIESGELLDLSVQDNGLLITKSTGLLNINYVEAIVDLISKFTDLDLIVTESTQIKASSIDINQLKEKEISERLQSLLKERKTETFSKNINLTQEYILKGQIIVKPIIKSSDVLGLLIMRNNSEKIIDNNLFLSTMERLLTI